MRVLFECAIELGTLEAKAGAIEALQSLAESERATFLESRLNRRLWDELKAINPRYSFAGHISRLPFDREEDVKRIAEGLTKAGLPID